MKSSMLGILVVIVVAGWLGTLIARDPGYVLVSYDGSSLRTSLWVALGLLAVLGLAIYYGSQLLRFLLNSSGYLSSWREEKKKSRAQELTAKGLQLMLEGDYLRAERFLISGAQNSSSPAINFLEAARAADKLNDTEKRDAHLRRAAEEDPSCGKAIALVSAEMSAARGEWDNCLQALSSLKSSDVVLSLRRRALVEQKDWQGLQSLMPTLRKGMDKESFLEFERGVVLTRISEPGIQEEGLQAIFKNLPASLKRDPSVVLAYCQTVENDNQAESILRWAIKENWQPELLECYGNLGSETLPKRLKQAEGWQKSHADDASLQLCLGKIYEAKGDVIKAREAYQRSINLESSREANEQLGGLLAFDGEYAKSSDHFKTALQFKK